MSSIKAIRERLGLTQSELAAALGKSQGNVHFYERGQTMPPPVAKRLIDYARDKGHVVTWEQIYGELGGAPAAPPALPPGIPKERRDPTRPSPYAGTDLDRRAPAGCGHPPRRRDPTRPSPYAGTDLDRRAPAGEGG